MVVFGTDSVKVGCMASRGTLCCIMSHIAEFCCARHWLKLHAVSVRIKSRGEGNVPLKRRSSIIDPVGTMSRSEYLRGDRQGWQTQMRVAHSFSLIVKYEHKLSVF